MVLLALLSMASVPAVASTDAVTFKFDPPQKMSHSIKTSFAVGDSNAKATFTLQTEKLPQEDGKLKFHSQFLEASATLNDKPFFFPKNVVADFELGPDGTLKALESNLPYLDPIRVMQLAIFVSPPNPLEVASSAKFVTPDVETERIPKFERTVELLESKEQDGVSIHHVKISIQEVGKQFVAKLDAWIGSDGVVDRLKGKFESIPLPTLSSTADGEIEVERTKSP